MTEIEIIEEKPISLIELKEKVATIKTEKEPGLRAKKIAEYINDFAKGKIKRKDVEEVKKKLKGLDILRLNERCITKIIDIQPEDTDSLRMLLGSENITIKQEDLNKIVECLK